MAVVTGRKLSPSISFTYSGPVYARPELFLDAVVASAACFRHVVVVNGRPRVKFIEWLRIFGSGEFVPTSEMGVRELAITDLSSSAFKLPNTEPNWNFAEFLSALKGPVDQSVLLLGSYLTEDRFREASAALERLGYAPFLLKDSPDLPIQRNLEKLFAAVTFSSFVVIIDDHASGHLAELATLL